MVGAAHNTLTVPVHSLSPLKYSTPTMNGPAAAWMTPVVQNITEASWRLGRGPHQTDVSVGLERVRECNSLIDFYS